MGRSPCCDPAGLKRGAWTPEEDQKLLAYIQKHGHGSWRSMPQKAGLQRCGKSCRLRWTNYLRPDIKRGKFSLQEDQTIIQLHALLGNRWSAIASHLPNRTDNEIKNYWNTHLKKRLTKMGIDPATHKPTSATFSPATSNASDSKNAANLSHMAQWENARLEAEARLVRESKLRQDQPAGSSKSGSALLLNKVATTLTSMPCLDVLKVWQRAWSKSTDRESSGGDNGCNGNDNGSSDGNGTVSDIVIDNCNVESPTSTLNFSENVLAVSEIGPSEIDGFSNTCGGGADDRELAMHVELDGEDLWTMASPNPSDENLIEEYKKLLDEDGGGNSENGFEENNNYWNDILSLVNCGSSHFAIVMK